METIRVHNRRPGYNVSGSTSPPWKAYTGCMTTPKQTFNSTEAAGYDEAVCAFTYLLALEDSCATYSYATFESEKAANAAGSFVTHRSQCGVCSNAQDLAIFLQNPDLTAIGIACGKKLTL